jgi:transcriptional regulator with XRE-family HTH domain
MEQCKHCGNEKVSSRLVPEFVDDLMGAPFQVVLERSVMEEYCEKCGHIYGVTIPDLKGLLAAIAMTRALDPLKLSGDEIKFLRKAIRWKAKELAEFLEISPEHLSRCEAGTHPLSNGLEKYLRHYACEKIKKQFVLGIPLDIEDFERMRILPRVAYPAPKPKRYRFQRVRIEREHKKTADGWDITKKVASG